MKDVGSFVTWIAIFIAGFLTGVGFSAWKLDSSTTVAPKPQASAQSAPDQMSELKNRIIGLEKMLIAQPDNVEATVQLANDYFDLGNYEKSVEIYQKASSLDPNNADVITDMGVAYRRMKKPEDAITAFKKALSVKPDHALALFNMGIVLKDDVKKPEDAIAAWEKFLEVAGDSPHAVMVKPWLQQLKESLNPK